MSMTKKGRLNTTAYLLYAVSLFGIVGLFSSAAITNYYTPLLTVDVIVYIVLALVAFTIQQGFRFAGPLYIILAIVWYAAVIFFLPVQYGQNLDLYAIFMQLIITIAAFWFLYVPPKKKNDH